MDNCMDCIETVARLHLYIDRELSNEEITIVQQHLVNCPHCECRFHFDISIKQLIHERCAVERAPERLREAVLRLIRTPHVGTAVLDSELETEMRTELEDY